MDFLSNLVNTTTASTTSPAQIIPAYWGYISLFIAVFFFGSNFLPVKQYETGDGMFFQLVLCLAIWSVGFIVNWARNFPKFYALPMLGGVLWTTGNINTVPIIRTIGLGLGMIFWGTVSLVLGWAVARFGWFGVHEQKPTHVWLNYIGVSLSAASALFYLFVKSNTNSKTAKSNTIESSSSERAPLIDDITSINDSRQPNTNTDFIERLSPSVKRILGTGLSVFSGLMYGMFFTPELYVIDNYPNSTKNGLDYVFSLNTGILVASLVYFSIYCVFKKNKPEVNRQVILPGLMSGWMWGIANAAWVVANTALSQAISFPIVSAGPCVIASLYGVILYKEVQGSRNLLLLVGGFTFTIVGGILCGISK